jgi:oxygen-independent coproporphyrinogen III oxidase
METIGSQLISKYNVPGPRYTSYPTVPYWDEARFNREGWQASLLDTYSREKDHGISLYIHLPFCESLCTFCGCHKRITRRHDVERPYIETLLREWELYGQLLGEPPLIREIHLGGGTPTFFSPENLEELVQGILKRSRLSDVFEFGFEGHPNNTTCGHFGQLHQLGFRRVSFGVQDYDEKVQKAINRIQPFAHVKHVTEQARSIGYTSISHDLVFGLPHQTIAGIQRTIDLTNELRPDRISFYSYAHVPWIKGAGQRGFHEDDLPGADEKRAMYEAGKLQLEANGYLEIGMDHFALPHDELTQAFLHRKLHRNFMGYTTTNTPMVIGLGMSAISDWWTSFSQNEKGVEEYTRRVWMGELPVFRGHLLTDEDLIVRRHILNLMCHFETDWPLKDMQFDGLPEVLQRLTDLEDDGLIEFQASGIQITQQGRPFVRNVCMAFDLRLHEQQPQTRIFSMTV